MANPHINYATFKSRFGDLGITEWTKYNYLRNYNFGLPAQEVPDEYLELEYIQSSGAQYIDSGIKGSPLLSLEYTFRVTELIRYYIMGSYTPTGQFYLYRKSEDSKLQIGWSYYYVNTPFTLDTNKHTVSIYPDAIKVEVYVDGTLATTQTQRNLTSADNLLIGSAYATSSIQTGVPQALYNVRLRDNSILIRDFHPVRRLSDGAIGMYDTVSGQFFGNAGTGSFTAGPMKQRYVRVEYVQFNGDDYIDTGILAKLSKTYKQEADVQFTGLGSQEAYGLNGGDKGLYWGVTGTDFVSSVTMPMSPRKLANLNRHQIVSMINTNSVTNYMIIDGTKYTTTRTNAYGDSQLYIGSNSVQYNFARQKLWFYKIYEDNVLLRNFVPVYDLVSEKYGLFDLVSGTFYASVNNKLAGPWGNIKHYVFTQANDTNIKWYGPFSGLGTFYIDLAPVAKTGPAETWGYDLQNEWHYDAPNNTSMTYREQDAASTIDNPHNMNRGYVFVPSTVEENARTYLYAHPVEFWLFSKE